MAQGKFTARQTGWSAAWGQSAVLTLTYHRLGEASQDGLVYRAQTIYIARQKVQRQVHVM